MAVEYEFRLKDYSDPLLGFKISYRGRKDNEDKWAVVYWKQVLNKKGEWEYEPMPSNVDDKFRRRAYTSFNSARERLINYLINVYRKDKDEN